MQEYFLSPIRTLSNTKDTLYNNEHLIILRIMTDVEHIVAAQYEDYIFHLRMYITNMLNIKYQYIYLTLNGEILDEFIKIQDLPLTESDNIIQLLFMDVNSVLSPFMQNKVMSFYPIESRVIQIDENY